jgi:hypothetical protein
MTVRDMVRQMQREIRDGDVPPERARVLLAKLSALVGNCNDVIRHADAEYSVLLLKELEAGGKANHARMRAETSPEYQRKREARDTKELVTELIASMKYLLRSQQEEMRLAR